MPGVTDILDGLSAIANENRGVAALWHLAVATALVALALGWRPSTYTARFLASTPLASVAALAFAYGNPFNGLAFSLSAFSLMAVAMIGKCRPVSGGSATGRGLGMATIALAWIYPHFLAGPAATYLYASPMGLIPCPTLALAIGLALLGNGLGSRAWSLILATAGVLYGGFGTWRLGVFLDIGLIVAALALVVEVVRPGRAGHPADA